MKLNKVKIGIVACASNASNTGSLAGKAALEIVKMLKEDWGITWNMILGSKRKFNQGEISELNSS